MRRSSARFVYKFAFWKVVAEKYFVEWQTKRIDTNLYNHVAYSSNHLHQRPVPKGYGLPCNAHALVAGGSWGYAVVVRLN